MSARGLQVNFLVVDLNFRLGFPLAEYDHTELFKVTNVFLVVYFCELEHTYIRSDTIFTFFHYYVRTILRNGADFRRISLREKYFETGMLRGAAIIPNSSRSMFKAFKY